MNTFRHPENLQSRVHTSKFWASTNKTYARLHCSQHKLINICITITTITTKSNTTKIDVTKIQNSTTLLSSFSFTFLHHINILSHIHIGFCVLHNNSLMPRHSHKQSCSDTWRGTFRCSYSSTRDSLYKVVCVECKDPAWYNSWGQALGMCNQKQEIGTYMVAFSN